MDTVYKDGRHDSSTKVKRGADSVHDGDVCIRDILASFF